jgi:Splicing factor 1 helix-hairpin domain
MTTIYTVGGQSEVPLALPNATLRGSSDERNPPAGKRRRRNRWSEVREVASGSMMPLTIPGNLGGGKTAALLKRLRIDEISARVTQPQPMKLHDTETRSPSPPPEYDRDGKRTNTRDQRVRHRLLVERQRLIEDARKEYPLFRPPPDFKSMSLKLTRKLFIPIKVCVWNLCVGVFFSVSSPLLSSPVRTFRHVLFCSFFLFSCLLCLTSHSDFSLSCLTHSLSWTLFFFFFFSLAGLSELQLHRTDYRSTRHDAEADGAGYRCQDQHPRTR